MKKKCIELFVTMLFSFILAMPLSVQAKSMNKQAYNIVKNQWWTSVSSGGDDVRFTKTKVKYYDRYIQKVVRTEKIRGCKKYKTGYLILLGKGKDKYSYFISKKKTKDVIDCYLGWKKSWRIYAGSGSLKKGKFSVEVVKE